MKTHQNPGCMTQRATWENDETNMTTYVYIRTCFLLSTWLQDILQSISYNDHETLASSTVVQSKLLTPSVWWWQTCRTQMARSGSAPYHGSREATSLRKLFVKSSDSGYYSSRDDECLYNCVHKSVPVIPQNMFMNRYQPIHKLLLMRVWKL